MSSLTSEQLAVLTRLVNERVREFSNQTLYTLSLGMVRLVVDVYKDWAGDVEEVSADTELSIRDVVGPTGAAIARVGSIRNNGGGTATLEFEGQPIHFVIRLDDDEANMDRYCRGFNDGVDFARGELGQSDPPDGPDDDPTDGFNAYPDMPDHLPGDPTDDEIAAELAAHNEAVEALVGREAVAEFLSNDRPKDAAGMPSLSPATAATLGEMLRREPAVEHQITGRPFGDYPPGDDPTHQVTPVSRVKPSLSPVTAATLGPEHTTVTPLRGVRDHVPSITTTNLAPAAAGMSTRPIGRDRLPDPDTARDKLATALATGGNGNLVAALHKPRTLAEVDGLDDDDDDDGDEAVPAKPIVTKETSVARAQQLERIKAERRRQAEGKRKPQAERILPPSYDEFLGEVKRQAMGGVAPTMRQFDLAKPTTWATAWAHCQRLGFKNWGKVADAAGLKMNRQVADRA